MVNLVLRFYLVALYISDGNYTNEILHISLRTLLRNFKGRMKIIEIKNKKMKNHPHKSHVHGCNLNVLENYHNFIARTCKSILMATHTLTA